jgi:hypothetical protein
MPVGRAVAGGAVRAVALVAPVAATMPAVQARATRRVRRDMLDLSNDGCTKFTALAAIGLWGRGE